MSKDERMPQLQLDKNQQEKTKKIWIPEHRYIEIAAFAKSRNRTVDEVVNDLLLLAIETFDVHASLSKLAKV